MSKLLLIVFACAVVTAVGVFQRGVNYRTIDRVGAVLNAVLVLLYRPLSSMTALFFLASDTAVGGSGPAQLVLANSIVYVTFVVLALYIVCPVVAGILRLVRWSKTAFVLMFVPLAAFLLEILYILAASALLSA